MELEERLGRDEDWGRAIRGSLAEVASSADGTLREQLVPYLQDAARSRGRRLARFGRPWSDEMIGAYIGLMLVDSSRFASDPELHELAMQIVPGALDPAVPPDLRQRLLSSFLPVLGFDFEDSETIEVAWGVARRSALQRELPAPAEIGKCGRDPLRRIEASFFSLPSALIEAGTATDFLSAVRRAAPQRSIVVLVDPPLEAALVATARELHIDLVPTHGQRYSPWPRDPFLFVRRPDGGVGVLLRPNPQTSREADAWMALELIQGLPDELDEAWGRVRWQRAPVDFHNGQYLRGGDRLWTSTHSVGPRIHQLLADPGLDLRTADGWSRYRDAALEAIGELSSLFGVDVGLVHPLQGPSAPGFLEALGGGSGWDLDSLLTMLDREDGRTVALLGDPAAGVRLLRESDAGELDEFASAYALSETDATWTRRLIDAQRMEPARGLAAFLTMIEKHLRSQGIEVRRLPLIVVPAGFAPGSELERPYLVTWNNVVLERRGDGAGPGASTLRAEGFAAGLPGGDSMAKRAFAEAGYELTLFPPLIPSTVRGGGYRCASQHLRAAGQ